MQILVLLGMYFDAVVVFVTSQTLLFRLALAILCIWIALRIYNTLWLSEAFGGTRTGQHLVQTANHYTIGDHCKIKIVSQEIENVLLP